MRRKRRRASGAGAAGPAAAPARAAAPGLAPAGAAFPGAAAPGFGAAVAGACDGDLPLGVLIDAVADLLDGDAAALRADLVPRLRPLIADGYLHRTGVH